MSMLAKVIVLAATIAAFGCASTGADSSATTQRETGTTQPINAWKGGLEVLHAHAQAPRSDPLYASILVVEDNAVLRLGSNADEWTATVSLKVVYRTPHYISLTKLADTGGYTEELTVTIAPLSNGAAEVSYLRTVNNYRRDDSHERRTFSIYARGRLNPIEPTRENLGL